MWVNKGKRRIDLFDYKENNDSSRRMMVQFRESVVRS